MKKLLYVLLVLCFPVMLLSGCGTELYQRMLITAIGVDWDAGQYTVSLRIHSAKEDGEEYCLQGQGETLPAAIASVTASTGLQPLYSHNRVLIFGNRCRKAHFIEALAFLVSEKEIRPNVPVFMAEDTAGSILVFQKDEEKHDTEQIVMLTQGEKQSGITTKINLTELYNGLSTGYAVVPIVKKEAYVVPDGSAVLRSDGEVAAVLNAEETRGYLLAAGQLAGGQLTVPKAENRTVYLESSRLTVEAHDLKTPVISVQVCGRLADFGGGIPSQRTPDYPVAEQEAAEILQQNLQQYYRRILSVCEADPSGALPPEDYALLRSAADIRCAIQTTVTLSRLS